MRAGSQHKWLEMHGREHWTEFYTDYGVCAAEAFLQSISERYRQRLERPAAGAASTGARRPVSSSGTNRNGRLRARVGRGPILDVAALTLEERQPAQESATSFRAMEGALTFSMATVCKTATGDYRAIGGEGVRIIDHGGHGPLPHFARLFDPQGREARCLLASWSQTRRVTQGWLRASVTAGSILTSEHGVAALASTRNSGAADAVGQVYELDIEIWPTSIIVPAGYSLAPTVPGLPTSTTASRNRCRKSMASRSAALLSTCMTTTKTGQERFSAGRRPSTPAAITARMSCFR